MQEQEDISQENRIEGNIKWFDAEKHFGFIEADDGQEYFVHQSQVEEGTHLRENDRVEFTPVRTDRGEQAHNVKLKN